MSVLSVMQVWFCFAIAAIPAAALTDAGCGLKCPYVHDSPKAVHGQEIVIADGHGGLRSVVGGGSACSGCAWKIVPECSYHAGTSGVENACNNPTSGYVCTTPSGHPGIPYRAFFSPANGAWVGTGNVCIGLKETPISLDAVLARVRVLTDELVPPAPRLLVQPEAFALVNLPTLMRAEGPVAAGKAFFVDVGAPIRVAVAVRAIVWSWRVDGSTVLATEFPGRAYEDGHSPRVEPDYYASYLFTVTGTHRLTVAVGWTATATIAGLGAVPIDGVITRTSAPVPVQVKQARAQLEANPPGG